MSSSDLQRRWNQPAFLAEVLPVVRRLLADRELHGPIDLRGIVIAETGAISELVQANLYRTRLSLVDLSHSTISGSMSEGVFERVAFDHAKFVQVLAAKAAFRVCSFAGSRLQLNANDATFERCDMQRTTVHGNRTLQEWGGRRTRFLECHLAGARFRGVEFRASTFTDCIFEDCVFERCDLRGTKFIGSSPTLQQCTV